MFLCRVVFYNVPATVIDNIQIKITANLKIWLGLSKSLSPACLCSRTAKLRFPYTELSEEVKAAKARNLATLGESSDKCIRGAVIKVDTKPTHQMRWKKQIPD